MVLRETNGLRHLRTRHRADLVTGPADDPIAHARLKRVEPQLWALDIADHRGKWVSAHVRATLDEALSALIGDFGWVLTPIDDDDPLRTSDREH